MQYVPRMIKKYPLIEWQIELTVLHICSHVFFMCLQQIDNLIHSNLADIVVELLMTLYEGSGAEGDKGDLKRFTG